MSVQSRTRTITVLSANPALGAILGREIEAAGDYRVPVFSSLPALSTFLRITPVDVAVLSLDLPWAEVTATVRALKHAPAVASPLLEIIVLSHAVPLAGVDGRDIAAALSKPVSPDDVVKAIAAILAGSRHRTAHPAPRQALASRRTAPRGLATPITERVGNVIPLFGAGREYR